MFRVFCILIGYCIGCIQTAYIIGRVWKTDLRRQGSGNLGTTNALRVLGKRAGAMVFAGDILKAVLAFVLCRLLFPQGAVLAGLYGAVGAVLGHIYPFYLKFHGGKGIASMIGMTAALAFSTNPLLALPNGLIGFGAAFATHYVSVGSMLFAVTLPISCYLLGYPREIVLVTLCVSLLALWRHRSNLKKLRSGTENKFSLKKR